MTDDDEVFLEPEEILSGTAEPDGTPSPGRFRRATLAVLAALVVLAVAGGIVLLMARDTGSNLSLSPSPGTTRGGTAGVTFGIDQQQTGAPSASATSATHTSLNVNASTASNSGTSGAPGQFVPTGESGSAQPGDSGTGSGGGGGQRSGSGPPRGTTSAPVVSATTSTSPATYTEEAYNKHGVPTFRYYTNASEPGPDIPFQQNVQVICKVYNTNIQSVLPGGYWYKIATAPWTDLYAAANTFLNGVPPTSTAVAYYDGNVPDC